MLDANENSQNDAISVDGEPAIVKWFSLEKGYGFVLVADQKNGTLSDLFIHIHVVKASGFIPEAQKRITIERGNTPDGRPCVSRVVKVFDSEPVLPFNKSCKVSRKGSQ